MIPGMDPKVDFAFKKVYGGEKSNDILPDFINAVRQRLSHLRVRRVRRIRVLNPFTEQMSLDEKLAILDIKAQDDWDSWFNVEMQMVISPGVSQRFVFYWAKVYTGQLEKGDDYRTLRPTISICVVDAILFHDRPDEYHTVFMLKSEDGQTCLTDDLEIHIIELPKFRKTLAELETRLDAWLYFLKNGASLDADNLPEPLNVPPIRKAMEVLKDMSQHTIDREIYEGRVKAQRDQQAWSREISRMESEVGRMESEVGRMASEIGRMESEANRLSFEAKEWHERFDAAARERDSAMQLVARQIQMLERLLKRPVTDTSQLMANSIDDLRKTADQLERELLKSE